MAKSPEQILMLKETLKDTSARAEDEALKKVTDIYKHSLLKHGLYRFGSEDTVKIDRFKGILRYGIVSQAFAKRIRADYANNYHDQQNRKGVSVLMPETFISDAIGFAITSQIRERYDIKLPIENILVLLINPNLNTYSTPSNTDHTNTKEPEKLIAYRIPQRFLHGIVIIDSKKTSDSEGLYCQIPCQENIKWNSSAPLNTTTLIVKEMLEAYKNNPPLVIPVYGTSGALYWPRQMNYQEVQNFVGDRSTNGA